MCKENVIFFSFLRQLEGRSNVCEGVIWRGVHKERQRIGTWQRTAYWNGHKSYSALLGSGDGLRLEFDSFEELSAAVNRYAN